MLWYCFIPSVAAVIFHFVISSCSIQFIFFGDLIPRIFFIMHIIFILIVVSCRCKDVQSLMMIDKRISIKVKSKQLLTKMTEISLKGKEKNVKEKINVDREQLWRLCKCTVILRNFLACYHFVSPLLLYHATPHLLIPTRQLKMTMKLSFSEAHAIIRRMNENDESKGEI